MKYAEVAVNSPLAQRKTFSYSIPSNMGLLTGQPVWVPFGSSLRQGIVMELTDQPSLASTEGIKEIATVIGIEPLLSSRQLQLARWISDYYLAPLFESLAPMLPPGFQQRSLSLVKLIPGASLPAPSVDQKFVLDALQKNGSIDTKAIEKHLGKDNSNLVLMQLQEKGLISRIQVPNLYSTKPRLELHLELKIDVESAYQEISVLKKKRAVKQAALLRLLADQKRSMPWSEIRQHIDSNTAIIKALVKKELISTLQLNVRRNPLAHYNFTVSSPLTLTPAQEQVWQRIEAGLEQSRCKKYLLHGITGSGKTELYMHALATVIAQGKRGIVLVPEIALTPQTISRFASRFPGQVAVLHSKLTPGEQFDEWSRIKDGLCNVVIGSRGAIFAPQPDLGLIILDEEHEWTYKQQDQMPRYHAREVARVLAELNNAVLILGSATPDIESYYRCTTGEYELLTLSERVSQEGKPQLPEIEIVDMRKELKSGNSSIFSRHLRNAILDTLRTKEQVILFLNRRGTSTFVQCRDCGFVLRCKQCNVALTHHTTRNELVCHHCNRHSPLPDICPQCGSSQIKFLGLGTEGLLRKTALAFPGAKLLRWDKDVTSNRFSHEEIMAQFSAHKADILVGTQMIAKGLDFPSVALVGVISADTVLTLPDLRAGERTFQLLSQVTGRAGRGSHKGKAIIQTYSPQHYAIAAVAENDYTVFYNKEIAYRRQLNAPPYCQLARLLFVHPNEQSCQKETNKIFRLLQEKINLNSLSNISLIGPAPAYLQKIRDKYRWQIIIRGSNLSHFLSDITFPQGWMIDIDPVSLVS